MILIASYEKSLSKFNTKKMQKLGKDVGLLLYEEG